MADYDMTPEAGEAMIARLLDIPGQIFRQVAAEYGATKGDGVRFDGDMVKYQPDDYHLVCPMPKLGSWPDGGLKGSLVWSMNETRSRRAAILDVLSFMPKQGESIFGEEYLITPRATLHADVMWEKEDFLGIGICRYRLLASFNHGFNKSYQFIGEHPLNAAIDRVKELGRQLTVDIPSVIRFKKCEAA